MADWILIIVFAGPLSGFGSVEKYDNLTKQQCRAALEWMVPGMNRSADGVCVGSNGEIIDRKTLRGDKL